MIKNQWYAILDSNEIKKKKLVGVVRLGEKLVLWRRKDGSIACIADKCCHRGAKLSAGKLCGDHIQCPFHGFEYNETGKVIMIPANGKNTPVPERYEVQRYEVSEKGGLVWLWWGEKTELLPPIPFFEELEEFSYSQIIDYWDIHYSRCIENQLDVMHLPFVHYNTIGADKKTLVNGPVVHWDEETMTFYVFNVIDDGKTIPLKPSEIEDPEKLFSLKFRFPNIWQNVISDKVRVFAAFVPIDEEKSVIYLRFYQKFVRLPILSHIVNFFGKLFSNIILKQDKRVVLTQIPRKTSYGMKEKLVQGDLPIIEYRRRRDELKKQGTI
jgi:phenylpropionate dioxygenase-like ring-hydroxylating dioxygenase large terminal subunit